MLSRAAMNQNKAFNKIHFRQKVIETVKDQRDALKQIVEDYPDLKKVTDLQGNSEDQITTLNNNASDTTYQISN